MQRKHSTSVLSWFSAVLVAISVSYRTADAQLHGVAIYLFDTVNATNQTPDSTTNGYDAAVINLPVLSTDLPPITGAGYAGNSSFQFTGSGVAGSPDPHLRLVDTVAGDPADKIDLSLTDLTIMAWIKPTQDRRMTLYQDAGARNFNAKAIGLRVEQNGQMRWTLTIEGGDQVVNLFTGLGTVPQNEWTHVAARLDRGSTNATIHLNGTLAAIADAGGVIGNEIHDNAPVEELVIAIGGEFQGAPTGGSPPPPVVQAWNGFIDEFVLSSNALSEAHIRAAATSTLSTLLTGEAKAPAPGSTITLEFETLQGEDYTLQASTDPVAGVWNDEPVTIHGNGDVVTYKTPGAETNPVYRLLKTLSP
jgi:hypothetical protein